MLRILLVAALIGLSCAGPSPDVVKSLIHKKMATKIHSSAKLRVKKHVEKMQNVQSFRNTVAKVSRSFRNLMSNNKQESISCDATDACCLSFQNFYATHMNNYDAMGVEPACAFDLPMNSSFCMDMQVAIMPCPDGLPQMISYMFRQDDDDEEEYSNTTSTSTSDDESASVFGQCVDDAVDMPDIFDGPYDYLTMCGVNFPMLLGDAFFYYIDEMLAEFYDTCSNSGIIESGCCGAVADFFAANMIGESVDDFCFTNQYTYYEVPLMDTLYCEDIMGAVVDQCTSTQFQIAVAMMGYGDDDDSNIRKDHLDDVTVIIGPGNPGNQTDNSTDYEDEGCPDIDGPPCGAMFRLDSFCPDGLSESCCMSYDNMMMGMMQVSVNFTGGYDFCLPSGPPSDFFESTQCGFFYEFLDNYMMCSLEDLYLLFKSDEYYEPEGAEYVEIEIYKDHDEDPDVDDGECEDSEFPCGVWIPGYNEYYWDFFVCYDSDSAASTYASDQYNTPISGCDSWVAYYACLDYMGEEASWAAHHMCPSVCDDAVAGYIAAEDFGQDWVRSCDDVAEFCDDEELGELVSGLCPCVCNSGPTIVY